MYWDQRSQYIRPKVTVHKYSREETIQGRKLYEEIRYLHSQYYMDKQTQFHAKNRKFVVSKFMKLSGELITGLICSLVVFVKKKYLRNSEFVFWSGQHHLIYYLISKRIRCPNVRIIHNIYLVIILVGDHAKIALIFDAWIANLFFSQRHLCSRQRINRADSFCMWIMMELRHLPLKNLLFGAVL